MASPWRASVLVAGMAVLAWTRRRAARAPVHLPPWPALVLAAVPMMKGLTGAALVVLALGLVAKPLATGWRPTAGAWVRDRLHLLPNALSASRVALLPVLWALALAGSAVWLAAGLVLAGLTDLADGPLARRLDATSRVGAQLDSLGDNLIAISGMFWIVMLRPDVVTAFLAHLLILLALYAAFLAVGWLRFGRFGNLHLYSAKVSAVLLYAFLLHALVIPGLPIGLFQVMWAVSALALVEALVCQLLVGEMDEHAGSVVLVLMRRRRASLTLHHDPTGIQSLERVCQTRI